jgi:hypothetical protein
MKVTKRQLKRIISEEKDRLLEEGEDQVQVWGDLASHLMNAARAARRLDPNDPSAEGPESIDLAGMLMRVWEAAGFDRDEVFK